MSSLVTSETFRGKPVCACNACLGLSPTEPRPDSFRLVFCRDSSLAARRMSEHAASIMRSFPRCSLNLVSFRSTPYMHTWHQPPITAVSCVLRPRAEGPANFPDSADVKGDRPIGGQPISP